MLLYAVTKSRRVRGSALPLRFRGGSDGSVQSSRWDEAIFLMIPGTSCLATIVLSLRDKTIRPSKRLAIILGLWPFGPQKSRLEIELARRLLNMETN
jgi:hypothetical protein